MFLIFGLILATFLSSYKNDILIFGLIWSAFFTSFYFGLYKLFDKEYSPDYSKSCSNRYWSNNKNIQGMLRFVLDDLKTKKMSKNVVKSCRVL